MRQVELPFQIFLHALREKQQDQHPRDPPREAPLQHRMRPPPMRRPQRDRAEEGEGEGDELEGGHWEGGYRKGLRCKTSIRYPAAPRGFLSRRAESSEREERAQALLDFRLEVRRQDSQLPLNDRG